MQIKLKNLSFYFTEGKMILDDLSHEDTCQSLAIIGTSGSGKSTLLRILGGLLYPKKGNLYFNNELINFQLYNEWYQKIGFVFQNNGLFPHLTGIQNITLPLIHVFNYSLKEAEEKAYELLQRFGLKQDAYKYPHQLSGGQNQRISIIRAVVVKPKLLLLDEPTSALDPEYTSEVLDMIHELTVEGQNIILVTHEMGFAKKSCEKIMFLSDGKIEEYNDSQNLFSNPQSIKLQKFLDKILEWRI